MVKGVAGVVLALNLVVLFDLTLVQLQRPTGSLNLVPTRTIRADLAKGGRSFVVNLLGNLAATAPIGFLWPVVSGRMRSAWRVGAFALGLSLVIETLQYSSGHRVADVDDLILNTLGGLAGYTAWLSIAPVGRTMGRGRGRLVSPREGSA